METVLAQKKKSWRRLRLPERARMPALAAAALLTGLGWTLVSVLITTQSLRVTLEWLTQRPGPVLACALLLALPALFLALAADSLFAGGLVTGVPVLLLSLVNYFKVLITSTPFQLSDLGLAGKLGNITELNAASIRFSRNTVLAGAAMLLWLVFLLWFSPAVRLRRSRGRLWALAPALLFGLLFCVRPAADAWCYAPLGVSLSENCGQAYANARCTVPLGLWRSVIAPVREYGLAGADESQVLAEAQTYADQVSAGGTSETKPNVIMILSESFFDVTGLPGVTYGSDPVAGFHAACAEGVSGKFYTRTLGYGTCNIELELLTGINNRYLPSDEVLYEWDGTDFDALSTVPRLFQENGYYTAFLHTFNDGIYNRTPIYEHLGFDDLYFSGDFAAIDPQAAAAPDYWTYMSDKIAGSFYSDDYMADLLIDLYEEKSGDGPVFLYGVTMENHTPYPADKYAGYDYPFASGLSDEAAGELNAVTQGAADASAMLAKLTDYFRDAAQPTVIIFFGDHRPGLPLADGSTVYSALGLCGANAADWSAETTAELYSTNYVIWANDPSLLPGAAGDKKDTSCSYLGLAALRAADLPLDPYWRMIESVSRSCTAYTWQYFVSAAGEVSSAPPSDLPEEDSRKLDVMTWLMRQAVSEEWTPAFYELR